ncbi:hypothetical protein ACFQVD_22585 [Streptosporangium amethystogenes subsp. fukuiense]|uniref:Uncharacterized protein n=1 Tax=Streptosporangium amethystogenes subsp. fukuiense TaxID=698418 RepID=A0ABW2T2L7_9ACTN
MRRAAPDSLSAPGGLTAVLALRRLEPTVTVATGLSPLGAVGVAMLEEDVIDDPRDVRPSAATCVRAWPARKPC